MLFLLASAAIAAPAMPFDTKMIATFGTTAPTYVPWDEASPVLPRIHSVSSMASRITKASFLPSFLPSFRRAAWDLVLSRLSWMGYFPSV
jgi:hypothetical protein